MVLIGVCVFAGVLSGVIKFYQGPDHVRITGSISGLAPGEHGIHIHEYGDRQDGCKASGPHYNPFNTQHGSPDSNKRHVGDLGNIMADENGVSMINFNDRLIRLLEPFSIFGRALLVKGRKDLFTNASYQAEVPFDCCIIGYHNLAYENQRHPLHPYFPTKDQIYGQSMARVINNHIPLVSQNPLRRKIKTSRHLQYDKSNEYANNYEGENKGNANSLPKYNPDYKQDEYYDLSADMPNNIHERENEVLSSFNKYDNANQFNYAPSKYYENSGPEGRTNIGYLDNNNYKFSHSSGHNPSHDEKSNKYSHSYRSSYNEPYSGSYSSNSKPSGNNHYTKNYEKPYDGWQNQYKTSYSSSPKFKSDYYPSPQYNNYKQKDYDYQSKMNNAPYGSADTYKMQTPYYKYSGSFFTDDINEADSSQGEKTGDKARKKWKSTKQPLKSQKKRERGGEKQPVPARKYPWKPDGRKLSHISSIL